MHSSVCVPNWSGESVPKWPTDYWLNYLCSKSTVYGSRMTGLPLCSISDLKSKFFLIKFLFFLRMISSWFHWFVDNWFIPNDDASCDGVFCSGKGHPQVPWTPGPLQVAQRHSTRGAEKPRFWTHQWCDGTPESIVSWFYTFIHVVYVHTCIYIQYMGPVCICNVMSRRVV